MCLSRSLLRKPDLLPVTGLTATGCDEVRSITSFTVESLLRSAAVKLPAPGNKSDTGEGRCHFEACNSSASSQCWPRCAPQGLLLLWGAIEGLGRHPPLRGKPFHRPHTVAKRTRLLCYGCRAMALPVVFVIYCPVADAVRQC